MNTARKRIKLVARAVEKAYEYELEAEETLRVSAEWPAAYSRSWVGYARPIEQALEDVHHAQFFWLTAVVRLVAAFSAGKGRAEPA